MVRSVKREPGVSTRSRRRDAEEQAEAESDNVDSSTRRRALRSRYLIVKNRILDERDDLSTPDSDKFDLLFGEVESLHMLVQKPREQVTDAEALLDITNTLVTSVKAHGSGEVTSSDFVSCLLCNFGEQGGTSTSSVAARNCIRWKDIGMSVSHIFQRGSGACTMLGPMNTEIKQRKVAVHRKRERPEESSHPEELNDADTEEKTDTDKNMLTMFNILKKHRRVRLENIVLNRNSFAQTVENLFALSFLIKDGRAEINVDDMGRHLVSPRNAPGANAVASGEASYDHFIFRLDFRDWKLMMSVIEVGEELMPHRSETNLTNPRRDSPPLGTQTTMPTTPIRKLCRNRGLVVQEQTAVDDSPERDDDSAERRAAIRKGKRKLR